MENTEYVKSYTYIAFQMIRRFPTQIGQIPHNFPLYFLWVETSFGDIFDHLDLGNGRAEMFLITYVNIFVREICPFLGGEGFFRSPQLYIKQFNISLR